MKKLNNLKFADYFHKKYSAGNIGTDKHSNYTEFHRCHVIEDYLRVHSLDDYLKLTSGVSNGVRHSLEIISQKLNNKTFIVPKDVYPVYQKIITKYNDNPLVEYDTIGIERPYSFLKNDTSTDTILLVCDPIQHYSSANDTVVNDVKNWLDEDESRIAIVDIVYILDKNMSKNPWIKLIKKGYRIIVLDSLSKRWALRECFGVAIVSPSIENKKEIVNSFKSIPKNLNNLKQAFVALNMQSEIPELIAEDIKSMILEAENMLGFSLNGKDRNPSYLYTIDVEILKAKGIDYVPTSLYGSTNDSIGIISLLPTT